MLDNSVSYSKHKKVETRTHLNKRGGTEKPYE